VNSANLFTLFLFLRSHAASGSFPNTRRLGDRQFRVVTTGSRTLRDDRGTASCLAGLLGLGLGGLIELIRVLIADFGRDPPQPFTPLGERRAELRVVRTGQESPRVRGRELVGNESRLAHVSRGDEPGVRDLLQALLRVVFVDSEATQQSLDRELDRLEARAALGIERDHAREYPEADLVKRIAAPHERLRDGREAALSVLALRLHLFVQRDAASAKHGSNDAVVGGEENVSAVTMLVHGTLLVKRTSLTCSRLPLWQVSSD